LAGNKRENELNQPFLQTVTKRKQAMSNRYTKRTRYWYKKRATFIRSACCASQFGNTEKTKDFIADFFYLTKSKKQKPKTKTTKLTTTKTRQRKMRISTFIQAILLACIVALSHASGEEFNTNNFMDEAAPVGAVQLRGSAGDNTQRELANIEGTQDYKSCAYKYYKKECKNGGNGKFCKREWKWHNEYMWCVEREGSHDNGFKSEFWWGWPDRTKLVYDGDCSTTKKCKERTDAIGTGKKGTECTKKKGDLDAYWQKYKC